MIHSQLEVVYFTTYAQVCTGELSSEFNHRLIPKQSETKGQTVTMMLFTLLSHPAIDSTTSAAFPSPKASSKGEMAAN